MKKCLLFLSLLLYIFVLSEADEVGFVVSTTEPAKDNKHNENVSPLFPTIYEMDVQANISNRFAKALIVSKVKNAATSAKEATFTVVLPEKAFISEFVMEIGEKSYQAHVKEKEEAKNIYNQAVASGHSAGHVAVRARDSNRFTVSINIEAEAKAVFSLIYEELLERKNNQYELVLNIHPGQVVEKLNVEVLINESKDLKFVKTPSLRSGNEISKNEEKLDPLSNIQMINLTSAIVKFTPSAAKQKEFALDLGTKESEGLSGQFVVQYDVERDSQGGEILLQDGYFVHFFAPTDLEPLPKHVVFVLDTSGSMGGMKLTQLKKAMFSILDEITDKDVLNIVQFHNFANVWDIINQNETKADFGMEPNYQQPFESLSENNFPHSIPGTKENIAKAKKVIKKFYANGGTYIIGGIETALYLIKREQEKNINEKKFQPIIVFLTDGEPNIGMYSTTEIVKTVTNLNSATSKAPIFALSFGVRADKDFLRQLGLKNQGFSRHIYESADASLQLQEFYKQISSPLLSNIKFKYETEVEEVTKSTFPIYFRGSEFVVAGKYRGDRADIPMVTNCFGGRGITFRPTAKKPVSSLERLWAYLTVKQTIEQRNSVDNKTELTKKALDLALKYSFVTDVTSLVVVKPNDTSAVDTEDASKGPSSFPARPYPYPPRPSWNFQKGASAAPTYYAQSASILPPRSFSAGSSFPSGLTGHHYNMPGSSFPSGLTGHHYNMPGSSFPIGLTGHHYNMPGEKGTAGMHVSQGIPGSRPAYGLRGPPVTHRPSLRSRLLNLLPWLATILNSNGRLTISQGEYKLGENFQQTDFADCSGTPLSSTNVGKCTLLKDCPEVYPELKDLQTYEKYFCPVHNRYAGVCCPKKPGQN